MSTASVTGRYGPDRAGPPRYYRHRGIARRLVPDTWGSVHGWIFVIFLVATFGPMFHWWADSNRLVGGWPISIGWILLWMILQTINLIVFFFTTVRPTFNRIALQTGVSADGDTAGAAEAAADGTAAPEARQDAP